MIGYVTSVGIFTGRALSVGQPHVAARTNAVAGVRHRHRCICMWPYGVPTSVLESVADKMLYSQANIAPATAPSATP